MASAGGKLGEAFPYSLVGRGEALRPREPFPAKRLAGFGGKRFLLQSPGRIRPLAASSRSASVLISGLFGHKARERKRFGLGFQWD